MFRNPLFIIGLIMMILSMMSVLSAAIILPVFLKDVLMLSAAMAGILLLRAILSTYCSHHLSVFYNRFDSRPFVVCGSCLC